MALSHSDNKTKHYKLWVKEGFIIELLYWILMDLLYLYWQKIQPEIRNSGKGKERTTAGTNYAWWIWIWNIDGMLRKKWDRYREKRRELSNFSICFRLCVSMCVVALLPPFFLSPSLFNSVPLWFWHFPFTFLLYMSTRHKHVPPSLHRIIRFSLHSSNWHIRENQQDLADMVQCL